MDTNLKVIVLFDQDLQHYRVPLYNEFNNYLNARGFRLKVYCDKELNAIDESFFLGIKYSLLEFKAVMDRDDPQVVIQFVWLKYKFLFPFMLYCKVKRKPIVLWSHGINLQNPHNKLKNQLYYLRQRLATSLIIYSPDQYKHIVKSKKVKCFVAPNTLHFKSLPQIVTSKKDLKKKYGLEDKRVLLSVARFDVNNRKVSQFLELVGKLPGDFKLVIIGSGLTDEELNAVKQSDRIDYLGSIYDQSVVCEWYKLSDLFIMPGAIGLAINQAFYFKTPILIEEVNHGPEFYYLERGKNGETYAPGNVEEMLGHVKTMTEKETNEEYAQNAYDRISTVASVDAMMHGMYKAVEFCLK